MQQPHFVKGVHRACAVALVKQRRQQAPVSLPVLTRSHLDACLARSVCAALVAAVQRQRAGQVDGRRDIGFDELGLVAEQGIEVLLARVTVVDVRHGLVNQSLDAVAGHPLAGRIHHLDHHRGIEMLERYQPSAVGEAAVRPQRVALDTSGQQGAQLALVQRHERAVLETVAVIVHVAALVQQRAVAALSCKFVPPGRHRGVISDDFCHTHCLYNAKIQQKILPLRKFNQ